MPEPTPPPESIRERLLVQLLSEFAAVEEGEEYWHTLTATRSELDISEEDHSTWPIVLITANELEGQQVQMTNIDEEETFPVQVTAFREASANFSTESERLLRDVVKVIEGDVTRNSLALNSRITDKAVLYVESSQIIEVSVRVELDVRRQRGAP